MAGAFPSRATESRLGLRASTAAAPLAVSVSASASASRMSAGVTAAAPCSAASSSQIRRVMGRMKGGTASRSASASGVHGTACCGTLYAPLSARPIISLLYRVMSSGVITRTPSARARFSASRRTMPRRNTGARATRASASGVQRTSSPPGSAGGLDALTAGGSTPPARAAPP